MRILFLAANLPVPANNGHAMRTSLLVSVLAAEGHDLTFVSFAPPNPPQLAPLSSWCREISLVPRRLASISLGADYSRRLLALVGSKPYAIERFRSAEMQQVVRHHLQETDFDLILADGVFTLVNLPDTRVPVILNAHNAEYMILERYASLERNRFKRLYASVEAYRMQRAEYSACQRSALMMVCSAKDRELLQWFRTDLPIHVVPNCVDADAYTSDIDFPEAHIILYQGGMDWYPNRDAVEFFAQEMFPAIQRQVHGSRFLVAGRNPSLRFRRKFASIGGVEFTGTVDDMRPFLMRAAVAVVPLRIGSGTRIKILEAGAAGKAIVSTRIGAEGLDLEDGKEIILADGPGEFTEAVVALLRDPQRRRTLGRAARQKVVECYSYPALRHSVRGALASVREAACARAEQYIGVQHVSIPRRSC